MADEVLETPFPVLAPLGALITVQSTVFATLSAAVQRVAAVAVGVTIALIVGSTAGLHWWSIVLVVFGGLLAGRVLRLDAHAIEVPISALLVLVVGAVSTDYSLERVLTMLLGAVVGIVTHLVLLPPVAIHPATDALSALGRASASLLHDIACEESAWGHEQAQEWLRRARELPEQAEQALAALEQAEESARFNPIARRSARVLSRIREGVVAAEHVATQTRGIARTLADIAATDPVARPLPEELRPAVLGASRCVEAFTAVVVSADGEPGDVDRHRHRALDAYSSAATALQHTTATGRLWALRGALLADLHAILSEVSPDGAHRAALP